MSEARELFPVTFFGGDRQQPGVTDFRPTQSETRLDAAPDPTPEDLEALEASGITEPVNDPDQLELDLQLAVTEATAVAEPEAVIEPVAEATNKGKVPPA